MHYDTCYQKGIRAWLAGDRAAACKHFNKLQGGSPAERAAREGLRIWCENRGQGKEQDLFNILCTATLSGFIDLYVIVILGLIAADWSNKNPKPLHKIALAELAVHALRLGSELSGPVRRRLAEVDNEIIDYRKATVENYLECLKRKYPDENKEYSSTLKNAISLRGGKLEGVVAVAAAMCLGTGVVPDVPYAVAVAAEGL